MPTLRCWCGLLLLLVAVKCASRQEQQPTRVTGPDTQEPPPPAASGNSRPNQGAAGKVSQHLDSGSEEGSGQDISQGQGACSANEDCQHCTWEAQHKVLFSLDVFKNKQFHIALPSPKGSTLKFHLCSHPTSLIPCKDGVKSPTCINVPGVKPVSTGKKLAIEQLEPNVPSMGVRLVYDDGDICEITKVPRKTIIELPCSEAASYSLQNFHPSKAWEGTGKTVCHYYVQFPPSQFGCPAKDHSARQTTGSDAEETVSSFLHSQSNDGATSGSGASWVPQITAVTGCKDSEPAKTTSGCHYAGKVQLALHGVNFHAFCDLNTHSPSISSSCKSNFNQLFSISIGAMTCTRITLISQYQINCTLENGYGTDLDVVIRWSSGNEEITTFSHAVSFKEKINYRDRFSKFVEMGVGGMKREINELYRRAFASRGTSPELLQQLGVGHVKGILLYGPPGSGKTLLARTIGQILGSDRVSLINAPEVISKFLGESERNLRAHFKEPHKHWQEYGMLSDLFVIIIDEIDAICKPRGKTDQSAAGVAYDALVNQLLTLMDGLNEIHNTLVIGLTNRRELMDPALLRPGRFEVQIEVSLPDEESRYEIFEIHTREMKKNGLLGGDVNCWELAANTSRLSGAEIAGIVRAASSYALERHQSRIESSLVDPSKESVVVTSLDFVRAIKDVSPAYTQSESDLLSKFLPLGYLPCGESHDGVLDSALDMIHLLLTSSITRTQSLLLYGPRGSGKTTLAAHLAMMGKFSFIRVLTAASLMGLRDGLKVDAMFQAFSDAYKSENAVIILDDLHRLVEFVEVGQHIQVTHSLLHTLSTLLTTTPPAGTKLMILATMTTADEATLQDPASLGLPQLFDRRQYVPLLGHEEANLFINARNIRRLGGGHFVLPRNLEVSVGQLLLTVDCACVRSEQNCGSNHPVEVRQDHLMDCIMTVLSKDLDFGD